MKKYLISILLLSLILSISSCSKEEKEVKKYFETALVDS
jgi:hypothetical protein